MPDPEALRRGDFVAAFDLSSDPGEEHELSDDEVAWASELCRRLADAVAAFLIPKEGLERLELDPETRRRLSDMGYGGG